MIFLQPSLMSSKINAGRNPGLDNEQAPLALRM
jgi:hypothetical protein